MIHTKYSHMTLDQFIEEISSLLDEQQIAHLRAVDKQIDQLVEDIVDNQLTFDDELAIAYKEIRERDDDIIELNDMISRLEAEIEQLKENDE